MTTATTSTRTQVDTSVPARLLQMTLLPVLLVIVWQLWATYPADATRARRFRPRVAATFVDLVANGGLVGALLQSLLPRRRRLRDRAGDRARRSAS